MIALMMTPHVLGLLGNTITLAVSTTLACALLGVAAAWVVERTDLPGRRVWAVVLALPVAAPDFVVGYAWTSLMPGFHGFPAAFVIMTSTLFPLVYLPVAASLRGLDPLLSEVGHSLGLGATRTFFRIVLPQIRTPVLGGCLLVVLGILAEYGAFEIVRFQTFTTAIFTEFSLGFDTPGACAQSLVLVALGLIVVGGEQWAGGRGRSIRSGLGARKPPVRRPLGWTTVPVLASLTVVLGVSLGLPLFSIVYWIVQGNSSTLPPASLGQAVWNTLSYSAGAAGLATLLAIPVARFAAQSRSWMAVAIEKASYLPQAIPGVVVGLSLVFLAINLIPIAYQTSFLLVVAYTILFFPLALVAVKSAQAQASPRLEEAGLSLGVPRRWVFVRVTLPLLLPGLGVSFALVFLSAATELTATLLLHPTETHTLATQFWRYTSEVSYGAAAPYAAWILAISLLPALLVAHRRERNLGTN